jgi:hypothetical protein
MARSCLLDRYISVTFDTQWITTMNCVWCSSKRLRIVYLTELSEICHQLSVVLQSVFSHLLSFNCTLHQQYLTPPSPNPFSIVEIIEWQPMLERCQTFCHYCFPVQESCARIVERCCPPKMDHSCFSKMSATLYFYPLLNTLQTACQILLARYHKENLVCIWVIGSLSSAHPKYNKVSPSSSASQFS